MAVPELPEDVALAIPPFVASAFDEAEPLPVAPEVAVASPVSSDVAREFALPVFDELANAAEVPSPVLALAVAVPPWAEATASESPLSELALA